MYWIVVRDRTAELGCICSAAMTLTEDVQRSDRRGPLEHLAGFKEASDSASFRCSVCLKLAWGDKPVATMERQPADCYASSS